MRLAVAVVSFVAAIGGALLCGPAAAAPDRTQGMALMSAFVGEDATLFRGAGAVSAGRSANVYFVVFDRGGRQLRRGR